MVCDPVETNVALEATRTQDVFGNRIDHVTRAIKAAGPHIWDVPTFLRSVTSTTEALPSPSFLVKIVFDWEDRPDPPPSSTERVLKSGQKRCHRIAVQVGAHQTVFLHHLRASRKWVVSDSNPPAHQVQFNGVQQRSRFTARFSHSAFQPAQRKMQSVGSTASVRERRFCHSLNWSM